MKVVFCIMKELDSTNELFGIYGDKTKAEDIAKQMTEKYNKNYFVETLTIL